MLVTERESTDQFMETISINTNNYLEKILRISAASIFVLGIFILYTGTAFATYGNGNYGSGLYNDTIDLTAPVISISTHITATTTDTTPTFILTTDEAGTLTLSGGCTTGQSSVVIGTNNITLNTLSVGTYTGCTARVTDAASNASNIATLNSFSVVDAPDVTAPTISISTQISTPTNDTTPSFVLTTNEEGTLTLGGSCSTVTSNVSLGANTITLSELSLGTYTDCTARVTDAASNASNIAALSSFTILAPVQGEGDGRRSGGRTSPPVVGQYLQTNISFVFPVYNQTKDVTLLQSFLDRFEGERLGVTGVYSAQDMEAVKRFQNKYKRQVLEVWNLTEATGYVGITTRLKINSLIRGTTAVCPAFTEYNGGISGVVQSEEIKKTQEILTELGLYSGPISGTWDALTSRALTSFQELFKEVMLTPWGITSGTGYKYKTTNKFLNYFAGCETGDVDLEGSGTFSF